MDCVRNYVALVVSAIYLIVLLFISKEVIASCPLGYLNMIQTSKYCYKSPLLHNHVTSNELHAVGGKTWKEAEMLCNQTPGAKLATFQTPSEFEKFITSFQEFLVLNSTLCPGPPVGCALFYFGMRRDKGSNVYRYIVFNFELSS